MQDKISIIRDISLLYELSLAVGSSLDARQNSRNFLNTLVSRKGLSFASVWVREHPDDEASPLRLLYAIPAFRVREKTMSVQHPLLQRLAKEPFFAVTAGDPFFSSVIQEQDIQDGVYGIFDIGNLGVLKMYTLNRAQAFEEIEMRQLAGVVEKFAISMRGCLAHDRLLIESRQRAAIQEQLQKRKEQLRLIINTSLDAVITIDSQSKVVQWNRQAEQIFGYSEKQAVGLPLSELIVPHRYREAHLRGMEKYLKSGEGPVLGKRIEITALDQTGREFPIELSITPIQLGHEEYFSAFIRDISARKRAESELLTSQTRLFSLIKNLQSGILLEDERRHIVLANQFFCDIFHIPVAPEMLIGQDCSNSAEESKHLFENPEAFVKRIEQLLERREVVTNEVLHMGDGRILARDYIPVFSGDRYLGHLWQYSDITEKTQAQEALTRSEEKYRGIIENMELGLLEVDIQGNIVRPFERFCQMTGYRPEELIGRNADDVLLPPEFAPVMRQQANDRKSGKGGIYEIQIRRKDGTRVWVLISGAPILDNQGHYVGSLGIHYDITTRKDLERALTEAKRTAEMAQFAERQFLANMSHEIRTPVNAMVGMSQLLAKTTLNEVQEEYVRAMQFSADTLLEIINDVLDLSKIEAGEMHIEEEIFDLRRLVNALHKTFSLRIQDKPLQLVVNIDSGLPNQFISDPMRIKQILSNLLSNAFKFTEEGEIRLAVNLKEQVGSRQWIEFKVRDTGIGIPAEKIGLIFQSFKQADPNISRSFGGTGLGLAIVRQLCDMLGGTVEVESKPQVGSCFTVLLPLHLAAREEEPVPEVSALEEPAIDVEDFLQKLSVLVAEDNAINQILISKTLDTWGCTYEISPNGRDALDRSRQRHFDLILMDINMPEMDGIEATRRLRSEEDNPNKKTPVIALTAAAMPEEKKRAFENGVTDFLTKPFQLTTLQKMALNVVHNARDGENHQEVAPVGAQVDLSYLLTVSNNDHQFILQIMETFLQETPLRLEELREAVKAGSLDKVYGIAHSLKPNLLLFGLNELEQLAADIEQRARKPDVPIDALRDSIQTFIKGVSGVFPQLVKMQADL